MVGSAHPPGVTRLKMCVKRSLKVLENISSVTLDTHNFSPAKLLQFSSWVMD
jgi:hypothetical protein